MPKNDIFGSIENNEFIKNLLGDSKKIFDDFLGLAQGKKIREGLEGTSDGKYIAEYTLRDFNKWSSDISRNVDDNIVTCFVNINDINNDTLISISKETVTNFLEDKNSNLSSDVFIDLLILSTNSILGKLESIINIEEICTDTIINTNNNITDIQISEKYIKEYIENNESYHLLTCIPKTDTRISNIITPGEQIQKFLGNIANPNAKCLLQTTKGSVLTVKTRHLGSPQFNVLFLAKNGYLHTFNYNPSQDWNFFEKNAIVNKPENGYYSYTTKYYTTSNYTEFININIEDFNKNIKIILQNNELNYYNLKIPNRTNLSWTGNKNANININNIWHTILMFTLTESDYINRIDNLNESYNDIIPIYIYNKSDFKKRIHSLETNGILCYSEFLGCFNDWPQRTAGFTKEYNRVTNNNQTQAMHDANQLAIDQNKSFFTMQWENQVFMPERSDINMQLIQTVKSLQNWLVGIEDEWWNEFFKWWIQDIENWIDDVYNDIYDTNIDKNFYKKFHELPVNYENKDFTEARANTGKNECQYDPDSGYIRGGAWANAFYKTMPNEECFEFRDVNLILDEKGLYIQKIKDDGTPVYIYIYKLNGIDYNTDLITNPEWCNKGYAYPNGKMKYNEFLCPRSYYRDPITGEISDIEYITDTNCKMRCFIDLFGTIHIECNFNTCSPNFEKIVKRIGSSYCNSRDHTSIYDPLVSSGSIYNSLTYITNTFFKIKEKEPINSNNLSKIEAVYLKFKVDNPNNVNINANNLNQTTYNDITNGKTFYYQLNKNNNMHKCDMKEIPNAFVFNPISSTSSSLFSELNKLNTALGGISKTNLINNINHDTLSECISECNNINNKDCYLATYSESTKQCNLYRKNIENYIFNTNSISNVNNDEKVYAKFCGPYALDNNNNYDKALLDSSFINLTYIPNGSFSPNQELDLSNGNSIDGTIVSNLPINFEYKDREKLNEIIKSLNPTPSEKEKLQEFGYPIIPFANINNPDNYIKTYYVTLLLKIRRQEVVKSKLEGTKHTSSILEKISSKTKKEQFTNINNSISYVEYEKLDNNMLKKIDDDTEIINKLIYEFNKYLYINKYNLTSYTNNKNNLKSYTNNLKSYTNNKNNLHENNIIILLFIIVLTIILFKLFHKNK